jgi:hypothetical protein
MIARGIEVIGEADDTIPQQDANIAADHKNAGATAMYNGAKTEGERNQWLANTRAKIYGNKLIKAIYNKAQQEKNSKLASILGTDLQKSIKPKGISHTGTGKIGDEFKKITIKPLFPLERPKRDIIPGTPPTPGLPGSPGSTTPGKVVQEKDKKVSLPIIKGSSGDMVEVLKSAVDVGSRLQTKFLIDKDKLPPNIFKYDPNRKTLNGQSTGAGEFDEATKNITIMGQDFGSLGKRKTGYTSGTISAATPGRLVAQYSQETNNYELVYLTVVQYTN